MGFTSWSLKNKKTWDSRNWVSLGSIQDVFVVNDSRYQKKVLHRACFFNGFSWDFHWMFMGFSYGIFVNGILYPMTDPCIYIW